MTRFKSKVSKRVDVKDEWSHVTINRLKEPEDSTKGCAAPSSGLATAFASMTTTYIDNCGYLHQAPIALALSTVSHGRGVACGTLPDTAELLTPGR